MMDRTISLIPHPIKRLRNTNWLEVKDLLIIEIGMLCMVFSVSMLLTIMLGGVGLWCLILCTLVVVWVLFFALQIMDMPLVGEKDD